MDFLVSEREWRNVINSGSIRSGTLSSKRLPPYASHDH